MIKKFNIVRLRLFCENDETCSTFGAWVLHLYLSSGSSSGIDGESSSGSGIGGSKSSGGSGLSSDSSCGSSSSSSSSSGSSG